MEKKYRVNGFEEVLPRLLSLGAKPLKQSESTHYYAPREDNDVVKLVSKSTGFEIHELTESAGKFELTRSLQMKDLDSGLQWLLGQGYTEVGILHMEDTEYAYDTGVVGIYVINHTLRSVILDFPEGKHERPAQQLGLNDTELIEMPYNKYLEIHGDLRLVKIDELKSTSE